MGEKYKYTAIITQEEDCYTVEFPKLGTKGRGFPDFDATVDFARDLLAESILEAREEGRWIPTVFDTEYTNGIDGERSRNVLIEVDIDRYQERIRQNADRVFYEFETDEDVIRRNQNVFEKIGKARLCIIIAAIILIICVLVGVLGR